MNRATLLTLTLLLGAAFAGAGCIAVDPAAAESLPLTIAAEPEPMEAYGWRGALEGPAALQWTFTLAQPAKCEVVAAVARVGAPAGIGGFASLQNEGVTATGTGGSSSLARVQAGGIVDTDDVTGADGRTGVTRWTLGATLNAGDFHVLIAATHAGMWDNDLTGADASMLIDLSCDAPFTLSAVEGSREVVLFDDQMRAQAAATPLVGAEAMVKGEAGTTFASPHVQLTMIVAGIQAGQATLETPGGNSVYTMTPGFTQYSAEGGPGDWGVTVDARLAPEAPIVGAMFHGALVGLAPLASPDAL